MGKKDIARNRDIIMFIVFIVITISLVANATVTGSYIHHQNYRFVPLNLGISLLGIMLLYGIATYNHFSYFLTILLIETVFLYDLFSVYCFGFKNVTGENIFSLSMNLFIMPFVAVLLFAQWKKFMAKA
jgi:hypothetical protein